jgi:hypothetical protein
LADAGIVSWDAKYTFNFCRPISAIHNADNDGNPNTTADADWSPLIATPPFPSYTSGHSTFSAAAAAVLAGFFGTDQVTFTSSGENPGASARTFTRFSQAAAEAGMSRIYAGIHWDFDNSAGLASGKLVGQYVVSHLLRPDAQVHQPGGGQGSPVAIAPAIAVKQGAKHGVERVINQGWLDKPWRVRDQLR